MAAPLALGSRVIVLGTSGLRGKVNGWLRDPRGELYYLVRFDGHAGSSGPFPANNVRTA